MPYQTNVLEVVLLDPNQTGSKLTANEAIESLANCLAGELIVDLSAVGITNPYVLPYDPTEGEDKSGLQVMLYTFIGTLGATHLILHPPVKHLFHVTNSTTQQIIIAADGASSIGSGSNVTLGVGASAFCYCTGVDIEDRSPPATVGDNTITNAKLEDMSQGYFKARVTSGTGDPENIAIGAGLDYDASGIYARSPGVYKTADYTPVLADAGKTFFMNGGVGNNDFTIPLEASVNFPLWTEMTIVQWSAVQTAIIAPSGLVFNTPESFVTSKQYAAITIKKVGSDIWWGTGYTTLASL